MPQGLSNTKDATLDVLLVEDNPTDALLFRDPLEDVIPQGFHLTQVDRLETACQHVTSQPPDVVLLDLGLPDSQGLETFTRLHQTAPKVPIIVLTGIKDDSVGLSAVQAGAQDYLVKGEIDQAQTLLRTMRHANERKRAEQKLEQAYQDLKRKHEEIQSFYHTLSHELKTPLTSAREFVAILMDGLAGPLNETQQEYLGIARESCDQLRLCLDDLLDTTRLETGKFHLEIKVVPLGELVERVVTSLCPLAREKQIRLTCDAPPDTPHLPIDEARITQVVTNLVNNALKFTEADGEIAVRVDTDPEDPTFSRVSVRDTGCGISPEHQERIFERLYQVKDSEAATAQGLGLGLYLCREFVQMHGGTIRLNSCPGQGSTFSFTLPAESRRKASRLLLVDDDPGICELLQLVLEKAGFQVITANTGAQALEAMQGDRPELVILDLILPDMDGAATLKAIRERWGTIPVIVHTGHPKHDAMKRAMEHSPFTLLAKPSSPDQIVDAVQRVRRQADTVFWSKPDGVLPRALERPFQP